MCRHGSRTQPGEGIPTLYTCRDMKRLVHDERKRGEKEERGEGRERRGEEGEGHWQTFSVVSPNILG